MILAALLLLAQDVPPPAPEPEGQSEEIVVRATFGRTTMLFDRGRDGKLRNCRVMVSSGSQRRDSQACQQTPVCYAKTADEVTDCVELAMVEDRLAGPLPDSRKDRPVVFTVPTLVQPKPVLSAGAAGPSDGAERSREAEAQRVKLPPPPKAPGSSPVVTFRIGDPEDRQ